jgi:hypothetical protein
LQRLFTPLWIFVFIVFIFLSSDLILPSQTDFFSPQTTQDFVRGKIQNASVPFLGIPRLSVTNNPVIKGGFHDFQRNELTEDSKEEIREFKEGGR